MEAARNCSRMGRCLHLPVVAMTAETLSDMGRCLHLPVVAMMVETLLDMDRCPRLPVAATTAETCGSFSSHFERPDSGFVVGVPEVGVWA
jgi:hypothetical protein